jgi:PAS domain S-box-containing protein
MSDVKQSSKRILIVDDDQDFGDTLFELLENNGYECRFEQTLENAGEAIKEFRPDVALLDIRLGNADGVELIDAVRLERPEAVSIMVTGNAEVESAIRALKEGAYDYIRKPLEIERLLHTLKKSFEHVYLSQANGLAQEELRQRQYDLTRTQHLARIGNWVWDVETDHVWWSEPLYSLLGYGEEADPSISALEDAVSPEDRSLFREAHEYETESPDHWESDLTIIRADGEKRWVHMIRELRRDSTGNVTHVAGVIQDTTEARVIEQRKKEQNELLMQANKMIALGELATGLGHELNNPNHVIKINATLFEKIWKDVMQVIDEHFRNQSELLVGGIDYDEMRLRIPLLFSGIFDSVDRIHQLIARMREFAHENAVDSIEDIEIDKVLSSSISLTNALINRSTKRFEFSKNGELPVFRGNFRNIQQVLVNVIQNACHSLQNRDESVSISTLYDDELKAIQVSVHDQGCGIPEEDVDRIIEPFFTTRREEGAMGLGLFTAYSIIKDHQGTIEFRPDNDRGTCVIITLPVKSDFPETVEKPS